jgi:hypothetical protein
MVNSGPTIGAVLDVTPEEVQAAYDKEVAEHPELAEVKYLAS